MRTTTVVYDCSLKQYTVQGTQESRFRTMWRAQFVWFRLNCPLSDRRAAALAEQKVLESRERDLYSTVREFGAVGD